MSSRKLIVSLFPLVTVAACAVGSPTGGGSAGGGFDREIRGGRLHAAEVPDFRRPDAIDVGALVAAPILQPVVGRIDPDQLTETGRVVSLDASRTTLVHVQLGQEVGGVPIHGAYLHLTARPATAGSTAHLVASSYHLFEGAAVDVAPAIDAGDAAARAQAALRAPGAPVRRAALAIWPVRGVLHLVWEVTVDGRASRALVYANGARTGEVEVLDERIDAIGGTARGWVAVGGAPGGAGTATLEPLPDLAVSAGTETAYTGADGGFTLSPSGGSVTASASGRAVIVVDAAGAPVAASAPGGPGVELDLGDGTDEGALAQLTAYRAVTEERAFLLANDFPVANLGAPVTTNVNLTDTCNAYFSPANRSLSFFHSGGGCQNSAERSVVGHEYGHFVDDAYGGILDGGLSEGWGDVLSCLTRKDPVVGPDLLPGQIIRTCDNDYVYPASGSDEVHALGQAWSGFVWHVRAGLVADLGEDEGDALTRALVLPSLRSNAADIPAAVREVFLRDDDDGDLSNHTPHWDVLMAAAQRHGLDFVVGGDLTAPAAVTDLRATDVHAGSVSLAWTATGDDGAIGTAAAYDLRWSTTPITESTFPGATPIPPPPPVAAGQDQALTFAIPPGEAALYVVLRARDEAGNTSPLSNVVAIQPPAPSVVFDDDLEDGGAGWTASGLWHATTRRASSGTTAFWYGQDATGTYDTGGPSQGDLVSSGNRPRRRRSPGPRLARMALGRGQRELRPRDRHGHRRRQSFARGQRRPRRQLDRRAVRRARPRPGRPRRPPRAGGVPVRHDRRLREPVRGLVRRRREGPGRRDRAAATQRARDQRGARQSAGRLRRQRRRRRVHPQRRDGRAGQPRGRGARPRRVDARGRRADPPDVRVRHGNRGRQGAGRLRRRRARSGRRSHRGRAGRARSQQRRRHGPYSPAGRRGGGGDDLRIRRGARSVAGPGDRRRSRGAVRGPPHAVAGAGLAGPEVRRQRLVRRRRPSHTACVCRGTAAGPARQLRAPSCAAAPPGWHPACNPWVGVRKENRGEGLFRPFPPAPRRRPRGLAPGRGPGPGRAVKVVGDILAEPRTSAPTRSVGRGLRRIWTVLRVPLIAVLIAAHVLLDAALVILWAVPFDPASLGAAESPSWSSIAAATSWRPWPSRAARPIASTGSRSPRCRPSPTSAVVESEDAGFWNHRGIDARGARRRGLARPARRATPPTAARR